LGVFTRSDLKSSTQVSICGEDRKDSGYDKAQLSQVGQGRLPPLIQNVDLTLSTVYNPGYHTHMVMWKYLKGFKEQQQT
jgi:hypothetical protein